MAGRDFWHHLRECMGRVGFTLSHADPDVWFRLLTRSTGEVYYDYFLLYVDNVLVVSEQAESVLRKEIGKFFVLKDDSVGPPSMYLGGKLRQVMLKNVVKAWEFGSSQYVQSAVKNSYEHLAKQGLKLPYKAPNPLTFDYCPEIDVSQS